MNLIDQVRDEIRRHFNPDNFVDGSEGKVYSPDGKYFAKTRAFRQEMKPANWEVTQVNLFRTENSELIFSFFVNEGTFFHSWITKQGVDYLLCAEDLCGGQTIIDLTNHKMSSYSEMNDGFIWTKHVLSPDETRLAVLGCGWGSPYFVTIYNFEDPMELPLKVEHETNWSGYDLVGWENDHKLKVQNSPTEFEVIDI